MVTISKNGKRLGRPPKEKVEPAAAQFTPQELAIAKAMQRFAARYDAAGRGRRMASWQAPSTGPNEAINSGLQTLRNRASDAVRNDWSGASTVQTWATNLVGIAVTPRFRRIENKDRRKQIGDLWADFVAQADADHVLDLYGMQTLAVRSWFERGEMFARRRFRNANDDLAVPMQVQLLEADMVPNFNADQFPGLSPRNRIRSGIEYNNRGQKLAYWVYKEHPGDSPTGAMSSPAASDLVRVPAEDMLHMFEPKRIGQRRGVPEMASVLARLRNINDYEDTTLERQKIANLFVAFISRTLPSLDPTDPNAMGSLTGTDVDLDDSGSPLVPMAPGLMQELEDGQTVSFAKPPDAGTTYSDYMRTSHLGTAAGAGLPYELMSGDIQNVSDRALRVVINEFRRYASQRQWQILIPMFCQRIVNWFAAAAVLAGKVRVSEFDSVVRVEHAPHGWEYIHPVQDVQGKALEVKNGFRSRSSVVSESGDDPDLVDQERAEDAARERDLGLPVSGLPDGVQQTAAGDEVDQDEIDNEEYSAPPNPAGDGVRALMAETRKQATALAAKKAKAKLDAQALEQEREQQLLASVMALLTEE